VLECTYKIKPRQTDMITTTSFSHPTFQRKIKSALWLAKLESKKTGCRSVKYVQNRNGRNVLRLDVYDGKLTAAYVGGQVENFAPMLSNVL
jgi:hypothetical protein